MNQVFNLDMTMMYAVHDAFRRDLAHIDRMTTWTEGWNRFSKFLHAHHVAEDEALWPVVRDAVGDQPDDVKLLDDMVTEHGALGPLLEAIDAALAHGESAPEARADLAARLQEHLTHEEEAALPVIDRTLTEEQWGNGEPGDATRSGAFGSCRNESSTYTFARVLGDYRGGQGGRIVHASCDAPRASSPLRRERRG